jgi:hypothetical protein
MHASSAEALRVFATLDTDPNPFDLVTPTKNNFGGIPEAIDYYQLRLDSCVRASALLKQAARLCSNVCAATERAADQFAKLKPAELEGLEVPAELRPHALRTWKDQLSPMVSTFADAATAYEAQGTLLERTIGALRRGQLTVVK